MNELERKCLKMADERLELQRKVAKLEAEVRRLTAQLNQKNLDFGQDAVNRGKPKWNY